MALRTFRGVASLREHLDLVRLHEGAVETHTKLPGDVARVLAGVLQEIQGAALRDGAEVLHEFIVSHTDANVRDREGARGFIDLDAHAQWILSSIMDCAWLVACMNRVFSQASEELEINSITDVQERLDHSVELEGLLARCGGASAHDGTFQRGSCAPDARTPERSVPPAT